LAGLQKGDSVTDSSDLSCCFIIVLAMSARASLKTEVLALTDGTYWMHSG